MATKIPMMKFKDFVWTNNPRVCSFSTEKSIAKHKYVDGQITEIEDLTRDASTITLNGEFFGKEAYTTGRG